MVDPGDMVLVGLVQKIADASFESQSIVRTPDQHRVCDPVTWRGDFVVKGRYLVLLRVTRNLDRNRNSIGFPGQAGTGIGGARR